MESKTTTDFLDQDYRDYAVYVVEERAIPSVIDGFKPTQRKVIYIANKIWKTGKEKQIKVFQLAGRVAADAKYHHGDSSLSGAIITMAQSFKNSMPVLQDIGQYGSLRATEAGAPRYVSTKLHENFRQIYMDFELLSPKYDEGDEIEPDYFLPIIPTVLLNGSSGIAVGFATNILNRNPIALIDCCLRELAGKTFSEPVPWYNGYSGVVEKDPESRAWIFNGRFKTKNTTTIEVNELPPSMTYEKYDTYLASQEDDRTIASYSNKGKGSINYEIKFTRSELSRLEDSDRLSKFLKLEERQTENLTVLDENKNLIVFNSTSEIIKYFVAFRLKYYDKRKLYMISKAERELTILSNRARFIKAIIDKKLKINNVPKTQIVLYLQTDNFDEVDGSYNYLLYMPIHSLTKEKYEELLSEVEDKEEELAQIKKLKPLSMYEDDLKNLRKALITKYK